MNYKNIVFLSDLHQLHTEWEKVMRANNNWNIIENSDIIVFSGDMCSYGNEKEVLNFLEWFDKSLPQVPKIFIAGNHDFFFEKTNKIYITELLQKYPNLTYLNDSGCEFFGIRFWGSPVTPWFYNWAFNRVRSFGLDNVKNGIKQHWNLIPNDTDVLIVHGPPKGILDKVNNFNKANPEPNVGCFDLLNKINEISPKVVAFGHIHEAYGMITVNNTTFINASNLNEKYHPINAPILYKMSLE